MSFDAKEAKKILADVEKELIEKYAEYKEPGKGFEVTANYLGGEFTGLVVCFTLFLKHIGVLNKWKLTPEKFPLKRVRHRIVDAIGYLLMLYFMWDAEAAKRSKIKEGV